MFTAVLPGRQLNAVTLGKIRVARTLDVCFFDSFADGLYVLRGQGDFRAVRVLLQASNDSGAGDRNNYLRVNGCLRKAAGTYNWDAGQESTQGRSGSGSLCT